MTKNEALKMAIDDLELCNGAQTVEEIIIYTHDAIKACKEALLVPTDTEQPAQDSEQAPCEQPVAWMHRHAGEITEFNDFQSCQYCEPLYTHPAPSWQGNKEFVGLSDDERFIIVQNADWDNPYDIAELIEQALKEKNNG